MNVSCLAKGEH